MVLKTKIKSFLTQCVRVWHILRKPDNQEFKVTVKVSAIGILLIGLIGFVVSVIVSLF